MDPTIPPVAPLTGASPNTALERRRVEGEPEEYGLALSGGGIRATLFHYGALIRIDELGHLREIDRVAGVSGGAIAAGLLASVWDGLDWDDGRATNLRQRLEPRVMRLASLPLDVPIVLLGMLPLVSPSRLLAFVLDRLFFHGLRLDQIPQRRGVRPRFVFNATDLATGTLFRFSEPYMGTYRVGLVEHPKVSVATAVAASASFPPFVSPLNLDMDPAAVVDPGGADLHRIEPLRRRAALVDGGAYDNLALEPITDRCHRYLVSDAGGNLSIQPPTWKWWFWSLQVLRTLEVAVSQDRALRRSALYVTRREHPYALWRTLTDPVDRQQRGDRNVTTPFPIHDGWPRYLATRSTRLWPFPKRDRRWLVNWGYVTSDVMLRSWIWPGGPPPERLPFEDAPFGGPPPQVPPIAEDAG
jgi:NTE family protein